MKVKFKHLYGNLEHRDYFFSPIEAIPESTEDIKIMLETGWQIDEWKTYDSWYQARQCRINLKNFKSSKRNRKILKNEYLSFTDSKLSIAEPDIIPIYNQYMVHKGFNDHLGLDLTIEKDIQDKRIIRYFYDNKLIGFLIYRIYPTAMSSLQFCWDYANPELELGKYSQLIEIEVAKQYGDYLYVGPGYEKCCIYKSYYDSFEWWTGEVWSSDKELYQTLCEIDCTLQTIDDLLALEQTNIL